jgi:hypothetical protein
MNSVCQVVFEDSWNVFLTKISANENKASTYLWEVPLTEDYKETCFTASSITYDDLYTSKSARQQSFSEKQDPTSFFTKSRSKVSQNCTNM